MRILPVIDVMAGQVVRGVAGRRKEYRPIISKLTNSTNPLEVALAFQEHFGFDELYLADLDAIAGAHPKLSLFANLMKSGFRLWVDAGIGCSGSNLDSFHALGIEHIIVALECLRGPNDLQTFIEQYSSDRLVFSLDLMQGKPLGNVDAWNLPDALTIAQQAVGLGVRQMIVLDLSAVGTAQGVLTGSLCGQLRSRFPELTLISGGGVRDARDLDAFDQSGADYCLVASALHDGKLPRDVIITRVRDRFVADQTHFDATT